MGPRDIQRLQDRLGLSTPECARLFAVNVRVYERWLVEGLGRTAIYEAVMTGITEALVRTDDPEPIVQIIRETVKQGGLSALLIRLLTERGKT